MLRVAMQSSLLENQLYFAAAIRARFEYRIATAATRNPTTAAPTGPMIGSVCLARNSQPRTPPPIVPAARPANARPNGTRRRSIHPAIGVNTDPRTAPITAGTPNTTRSLKATCPSRSAAMNNAVAPAPAPTTAPNTDSPAVTAITRAGLVVRPSTRAAGKSLTQHYSPLSPPPPAPSSATPCRCTPCDTPPSPNSRSRLASPPPTRSHPESIPAPSSPAH